MVARELLGAFPLGIGQWELYNGCGCCRICSRYREVVCGMNSSFLDESADEGQHSRAADPRADTAVTAPAWFRGRREAGAAAVHPSSSSAADSRPQTESRSRGPRIRVKAELPPQPEQSRTRRLAETLWSASAHSWYTSLLLHASVLLLLLAIVLPHHSEDIGGINAVFEDDDGPGDAGMFDQEIPDTAIEVQQASDEPPPENLSVSELIPSGRTGRGIGDFELRMPKGGKAVTRGSFTAWTVPEDPVPGQQYRIVIQVKLPAHLKRYRISDLDGRVVGTDRYQQKLPIDDEKPANTRTIRRGKLVIARRNELLPVRNHVVELSIFIPGAENLVRDTIHIESKILKEKQTLEIVF